MNVRKAPIHQELKQFFALLKETTLSTAGKELKTFAS